MTKIHNHYQTGYVFLLCVSNDTRTISSWQQNILSSGHLLIAVFVNWRTAGHI